MGMLFAFFEPVGPTASSLVQRQKAFIAFTVQFSCDDILYSVSIAAISRGGYLSRPGRHRLQANLKNYQRTLSSLYMLNFSSQVTTGIFSHTAWAMIWRSNGSAWCGGRSKR